MRSYPDVIADRGLLETVLSRLEVYPGRKQLANWRELADAGDYAELVRQVVERHYDPSYTRFASRDQRPKLASLTLGALDEAAQDGVAREIVGLLQNVERAG